MVNDQHRGYHGDITYIYHTFYSLRVITMSWGYILNIHILGNNDNILEHKLLIRRYDLMGISINNQ